MTDEIIKLITANRVKRRPKLEESINRLQKLLEKIKAVSYITMDNKGVIDTAKFGYTGKITKGKYKVPRFTDDEYEELFEYLLEEQPNMQNKLSKKSHFQKRQSQNSLLLLADLSVYLKWISPLIFYLDTSISSIISSSNE